MHGVGEHFPRADEDRVEQVAHRRSLANVVGIGALLLLFGIGAILLVWRGQEHARDLPPPLMIVLVTVLATVLVTVLVTLIPLSPLLPRVSSRVLSWGNSIHRHRSFSRKFLGGGGNGSNDGDGGAIFCVVGAIVVARGSMISCCEVGREVDLCVRERE